MPIRLAGVSLRARLMIGAAILAVVFMLALLTALQRSFDNTMQGVIEQRLAADASTLIGAAHMVDGQLQMPDRMPDEEFNLPDAKLLGYIFDREGKRIWQSRSAEDEPIYYLPRYQGGTTEFVRTRDGNGQEYFVFDVEIMLSDDTNAAYSFITMQPASEYQGMLDQFRRQLYLWLGGGLLVLLVLLWLGLTWGFRSLRRLSVELDNIESGNETTLSEHHPHEMLRLTRSLNRLLESERRQRGRYRHALADLAHSLKTPLSVLQSISETLAPGAQNREQARVLQTQIERMSQQIDYQLQRATLGKSGLVKYRVELEPMVVSLCGTLDKVYLEKSVRTVIQIPEKCMAPMERGALMELLGNLLENAYRLCLEEVRVSARWMTGGALELSVEDDGPGIPTEQRERILRRGERLDAQHPGQGIGLAVVKDIIDSYDAELTLEESALGGALFRIRIERD
ncbi:ATP-binding protein [Pseudomonas matsuisoli]|uniref:histidine kinase n=1 Tax=Pseudomonas matsuisoli TaxID=1515666 RepID=A0A917PNW0_9PSED|nr:ATP-binding protein [Pseudomonas matsuisoli]GGJ85376.1 two-component sensor histidine kinase [Pseudomonas matsuisoli]